MSRSTVVPEKASTWSYTKAGHPERVAQRLFFALLRRLTHGKITIIDSKTTFVFGGHGSGKGLEATVWVHHPRFYINIVLGGSIGAGEAYIAGTWSVDDLPALFRIVLRNRSVFEGMSRGRPGLLVAILRYAVLTVPLAWLGLEAARILGQPAFYGLLAGLLAVAGLSSGVILVWVRVALRALPGPLRAAGGKPSRDGS